MTDIEYFVKSQAERIECQGDVEYVLLAWLRDPSKVSISDHQLGLQFSAEGGSFVASAIISLYITQFMCAARAGFNDRTVAARVGRQ